jgi:hypothetical protein
MNILKLVLVVAVGAGAFNYWRQHSSPGLQTGSHSSANGFVALPPVQGQNPSTVLVIAAEDCPEEDAQRADRLADDLKRKGLPVARIHHLTFDLPGTGGADVNLINSVMGGTLPIVIVHGKAQANPSLDQVIAEYSGAAR